MHANWIFIPSGFQGGKQRRNIPAVLKAVRAKTGPSVMGRFLSAEKADLLGVPQPTSESDGTLLCPTHYKQLHRVVHDNDQEEMHILWLYCAQERHPSLPRPRKSMSALLHMLPCSTTNCKMAATHQR